MSKSSQRASGPRIVRVAVIVVVAFVLILAVRHAVDPYDERDLVAIPHGDHSHWVPRDRDRDVPIGNFPTVPPGPNERITPDGRVVPINR